MEILLNNEDKLKLSWNPGCTFDGKTYYPPIGPMGMTENFIKSNIPTEITAPLEFHISLRNNENVDLYQRIKAIIFDINKTDQISITVKVPQLIKNKLDIKDIYKEQVEKSINDNEIVKEKCLILINQLNELGCYTEDIEYPIFKTIPNEWYNWHEYIDYTKAVISVKCHNKTQFYIFLKEHGLLDKYIPEWYKPFLNRK